MVAKVRRDIIVIGASAGGVDALKRIVSQLPADLAASVLIVLHVWPGGPSILPQILTRAGALSASHPSDREPLQYGRIYVAPPDYHLTVDRGIVCVLSGPKENRHRPAIDPLFRSAAAIYGARVAGCILTGSLDDGAAGCLAIHRHGGMVIVQDPEEAQHPDLPMNVIQNMSPDEVLPLAAIPEKLVELAGRDGFLRPLPADADPVEIDSDEVRIGELDMERISADDHPGRPSTFACPECHGTLWELDDAGLLRFRCRVGHAYTAVSLEFEQTERVEQALWTAFRAVEEAASLHRRMADRASRRGSASVASEHLRAAMSEEESARVLRELLLKPRTNTVKPERA
jgi:two-component system chemotaxis response regulator CheB